MSDPSPDGWLPGPALDPALPTDHWPQRHLDPGDVREAGWRPPHHRRWWSAFRSTRPAGPNTREVHQLIGDLVEVLGLPQVARWSIRDGHGRGHHLDAQLTAGVTSGQVRALARLLHLRFEHELVLPPLDACAHERPYTFLAAAGRIDGIEVQFWTHLENLDPVWTPREEDEAR